MHTHMLGRIEIDQARMADELELSEKFHYAEQYPEFQSGKPWKTCMLWSCGGAVGDGVIAHYDTTQPAQPTIYGEQLPYLNELMEQSVAVEHLLFARLVVMTNAVLLPHRDYVEFTDTPNETRPGHRLHIPLATNEDCLFMENDIVYRMHFGEFWSLDVSQMHSAAVLTDTRRMHLIMDFADVSSEDVLRIDQNAKYGIPEANVVDRPPLCPTEREGILGLYRVVDTDNLNEVFGIVLRKSYRRAVEARFAWHSMTQIVRESGDRALVDKIDELHRLCMLERNE